MGAPASKEDPELTLYSTKSTRFWSHKQTKDAAPLTLQHVLVAWVIEQRNEQLDASASEEEQKSKKRKQEPPSQDQPSAFEIDEYVQRFHVDGLWIHKFALDNLYGNKHLPIKELRLMHILPETECIRLNSGQLQHIRLVGCIAFARKACLWTWLQDQCLLKSLHWSLSLEEFAQTARGCTMDWVSDSVRQLAARVLTQCEKLDIAAVLAFFWHPDELDTFETLLYKTSICTYETNVFPARVRQALESKLYSETYKAEDMFLSCAKRTDVYAYGTTVPDVSLFLDHALDRRILHRIVSGHDFRQREVRLGDVASTYAAKCPFVLRNIHTLHWYSMTDGLCHWICKSLDESSDDERIRELSCWGAEDVSLEHKAKLMEAAFKHKVVLPKEWRIV